LPVFKLRRGGEQIIAQQHHHHHHLATSFFNITGPSEPAPTSTPSTRCTRLPWALVLSLHLPHLLIDEVIPKFNFFLAMSQFDWLITQKHEIMKATQNLKVQF